VSIEIHECGANWWRVDGVAATWLHRAQPYFVAGPNTTFMEQIATGAFDWSDRAELRLEHRPDGPVLASVQDGTLRFENGADGLLLGAALSKADQPSVDAVSLARSRKLTGVSVGIRVLRDEWSTAEDGRTALRTISAATLDEVSVVSRPANTSAMVTDMRDEQRSTGCGVEYRSVRLAIVDEDDDADDLERELWLSELEHSRRIAAAARRDRAR
jgi:HK97 family phage prohead protease